MFLLSSFIMEYIYAYFRSERTIVVVQQELVRARAALEAETMQMEDEMDILIEHSSETKLVSFCQKIDTCMHRLMEKEHQVRALEKELVLLLRK